MFDLGHKGGDTPLVRKPILAELHTGHSGINRMKALVRNIVWWPGLDRDIQDRAEQCSMCQSQWSAPPKAPLQPWS